MKSYPRDETSYNLIIQFYSLTDATLKRLQYEKQFITRAETRGRKRVSILDSRFPDFIDGPLPEISNFLESTDKCGIIDSIVIQFGLRFALNSQLEDFIT